MIDQIGSHVFKIAEVWLCSEFMIPGTQFQAYFSRSDFTFSMDTAKIVCFIACLQFLTHWYRPPSITKWGLVKTKPQAIILRVFIKLIFRDYL
jgi:hypothetical protein